MPVKILHFSTHNEDCGIGKYQEMFLAAMNTKSGIQNDYFNVSPNKIRLMSQPDKEETFKELSNILREYDVLHVQHEFSFYPKDEFLLACQVAKDLNKKLIVTVHTAPSVAFVKAKRTGIAPRSILHFIRAKKKEMFYSRYFAVPLSLADLVLVHNEVTKRGVIELGVSPANITKIIIPVPEVGVGAVSTEIAKNLNRQDGDIIYATTGFLHQYKGIDDAIKALKFLPSNYKLAIVGGMHQDHDHKIYNNLTDLIVQYSLENRVYITGYVEDDNRLNALIRECDVCVYPYEKVYYSNVSSAALNNAFANNRPVIAYPTASFRELNHEQNYMQLTKAFSYYELSRELKRIDLSSAAKKSKEFGRRYSYPLMAEQLATIYKSIVT